MSYHYSEPHRESDPHVRACVLARVAHKPPSARTSSQEGARVAQRETRGAWLTPGDVAALVLLLRWMLAA